MRVLIFIISVAAALAMLFRWRYRIMNTILAVGILRKLVVSLSMSVPGVKEKMISGMFRSQ
ncbi:hypothetical protein [Virgibacillus sediminis]|uniref:Uncharacterized protein n=1 Tax=Virgibacillus sediminis TaxID=202260 RepID=A0ABV7A5X8_9BACI